MVFGVKMEYWLMTLLPFRKLRAVKIVTGQK